MSNLEEAARCVDAARAQMQFANQVVLLSEQRTGPAAMTLLQTALTAIGIARYDLRRAEEALNA